MSSQSEKFSRSVLPALAGGGIALALMTGMAHAQDVAAAPAADTAYIFNTLLFLIGGFLVMWMAAGFAMLEAGLVRSKNVSMQCLKNIALYSIAGLMYWLIGYNLMYTDVDGGYIGSFSFIYGMDPVGLEGADSAALARYRLFDRLRLVLPDGVCRNRRIDRLRYRCRTHQALAIPDLRRRPDRLHLPDRRFLAVGRRLAL